MPIHPRLFLGPTPPECASTRTLAVNRALRKAYGIGPLLCRELGWPPIELVPHPGSAQTSANGKRPTTMASLAFAIASAF